MKKDKTQLLRLIFIDRKIREGMKSGNYANCANMAKEYEVSSKSILRDIDYLKNQRDAPILYDPKKKGYYYSEENFQLPAMEISAGDLFALCIAEKVFKQHENTPIYKKLTSVFKKIEESLPEQVSIHPSWIDSSISVVGEYRTAIDPQIWQVVANSLQHSKILSISYKKPGDKEVSKREVEPYHIVSFQGEWYLIAFCHNRKSILTFAISRIIKATLQQKTFTVPNDFDYRQFSKEKFGIFNGPKSFKVEILFDRNNAPFIEEREWHPSQKLERQSDGSLILTISASHYLEVKKWVLSWGSGAEVLKPKELRMEIQEELRKMVQQYEST